MLQQEKLSTSALSRVPKAIWVLGFVSLFMDVSSEMVHALLPIFLTTVLHAGASWLGIIEGVAEATAFITKIFSGALSDHTGRRKALAAFGYGLAAISKPFFAIANSVGLVVVARMVDRIGKGIRGAPRDALIGELSPPEVRGASFGLRQALDTVGAFIGPLVAIALMSLFSDNIRAVFWVAVIPGLISVALLLFGLQEPERVNGAGNGEFTHWTSSFRNLGRRFWMLVAFAAVFSLARFSEAFLVLKASSVGIAPRFVPMVLVVMNIVYAFSSYPAGYLSDHFGRRVLVHWGLLILVAADVVLAFSSGGTTVMAGVALWGLHMGLTQGVLSAFVSDTVPVERMGTAFGIMNFVIGVSLLIASTCAGFLWDYGDSGATYLFGAVWALISLTGFRWLVR